MNPRQPGPQPGALPTELHPPQKKTLISISYIVFQENLKIIKKIIVILIRFKCFVLKKYIISDSLMLNLLLFEKSLRKIYRDVFLNLTI